MSAGCNAQRNLLAVRLSRGNLTIQRRPIEDPLFRLQAVPEVSQCQTVHVCILEHCLWNAFTSLAQSIQSVNS